MNCCYGIFRDGETAPVAVFEDLEDAMEWGVLKFGGGRFSIRHVPLAAEPTPSSGERQTSN
jgi:hypothetical protein